MKLGDLKDRLNSIIKRLKDCEGENSKLKEEIKSLKEENARLLKELEEIKSLIDSALGFDEG